MSKKVRFGVALFSGLFFYQFFSFNVLQDDAFISFRYVRNFLEGWGLVFNVGERVEGYTNFLWIILLTFLTKLGLPLIETARSLGVAAAVGTILLAAYAAYKQYPKRDWLWALSVPLLLAANGALAYWAGSGLETGLFTLLATAAGIFYLSRPALSFLFVTLAALTRPEGALLAFLFGIAGILLKQKSWKATLKFWGASVLIMLPYAAFKLFYYGSLLPNPFYAKTGFSLEYWKSGLEYSFLFLKHYGLYGLTLLLPLLFWKKLNILSRFSLLVFLGYGLYVTAVGGDVLKAHRFFVPALVFLYFPFADTVYRFLERLRYKSLSFAAALLSFGFCTYRLPLPYLETWARAEREIFTFINKETSAFAGDPTAKSFAVSALGVFSYNLPDRRVIDMLGLTEPVIARHPEGIEGLFSTWRERNYNAGYVLSQKPDVILFSTGFKPSGLAERALFLYPDFRQNYRLEFLYQAGAFDMYYRRFRNNPVGTIPDQPARFVNLFNEGVNRLGRRDFPQAISLLRQALSEGPKDYSVLYITLGFACKSARQLDSAEAYLKKGIELDGGGSISRYYYASLLGDLERFDEADRQISFLIQIVPNAAEFLETVRKPAAGR